jgi:hypothetical protein
VEQRIENQKQNKQNSLPFLCIVLFKLIPSTNLSKIKNQSTKKPTLIQFCALATAVVWYED